MMTNKDNPTSPRDQALSYYDQFSWFVIPTDPGAKKPYYAFTYRDRYGDHLPTREVVASWEEWDKPGVRVGTRTGAVSGIIVLDVDSKEAHDFIKARQHPICPMVQSPREGGGLHLYFKHPGFYVKSTVALGGVEGLDIRGDGGIVVLPPSPDHKSGRAYEWIIPPDEVPIPEVPTWVLELLEKQSRMKEPLDAGKIMEGIPEGQRDTELNRLAGWLRHKNFPKDVAVDVIEKAAERCRPPFNKGEAKAKVVWAFTHYEAGEDFSPILRMGQEDSENGKKGSPFETFTLQDLMEEEFPPVRWAIKGLLPEGSMIFAGKPKMGKSWMALGMCIAVATGGKALGHFDVEVGDVLYLALEDQKRRLKGRAQELMESELVGDYPPNRLHMRIRSRKLDAGLLEDIEKWLKEHPEARLVVIDTLGSVRGRSTDRRTLYEQDYEVGSALTQLAGDYAVSILIVHHLRKGDAEDPMDMISGSTGLTGGLDGAMVLNRTRSAADGFVKVVHRDLEEDLEMALSKVDSAEGWWLYAGDAEEYKMSKERRDILEVLINADEPMKPSEIADILDKTSENIRQTLRRMLDDGHVDVVGYGQYIVSQEAPTPSTLHPSHSSHTSHSSSSTSGSTVTTVTSVTGGNSDQEEMEWE